jgi:hypothetical protein
LTHVKVISVLFIVFGVFWILGAFFSTLVLSVVAGIIGTSSDPDAPVGVAILGMTGVILTTALLAFGVPQVICGWGMLKFKPWARILGIVLAAISILNVPVGTVFGVYAMVILFRQDIEALFKN